MIPEIQGEMVKTIQRSTVSSSVAGRVYPTFLNEVKNIQFPCICFGVVSGVTDMYPKLNEVVFRIYCYASTTTAVWQLYEQLKTVIKNERFSISNINFVVFESSFPTVEYLDEDKVYVATNLWRFAVFG